MFLPKIEEEHYEYQNLLHSFLENLKCNNPDEQTYITIAYFPIFVITFVSLFLRLSERVKWWN